MNAHGMVSNHNKKKIILEIKGLCSAVTMLQEGQ
jgi:hypothetical protein